MKVAMGRLWLRPITVSPSQSPTRCWLSTMAGRSLMGTRLGMVPRLPLPMLCGRFFCALGAALCRVRRLFFVGVDVLIKAFVGDAHAGVVGVVQHEQLGNGLGRPFFFELLFHVVAQGRMVHLFLVRRFLSFEVVCLYMQRPIASIGAAIARYFPFPHKNIARWTEDGELFAAPISNLALFRWDAPPPRSAVNPWYGHRQNDAPST